MKVQFVIEDESLLADKEIHPQPISNYAPDWFKNLNIAKPKTKSLLEKFTMTNNVKSCPSFIDVYQDGFVILAPNDYILAYDENTGYYEWRVAAQFQRPEYNTKNKTNKKIRDRLLVNENILYASFGKKTKNTEYFSSE
jgi:hypothetical protein